MPWAPSCHPGFTRGTPERVQMPICWGLFGAEFDTNKVANTCACVMASEIVNFARGRCERNVQIRSFQSCVGFHNCSRNFALQSCNPFMHSCLHSVMYWSFGLLHAFIHQFYFSALVIALISSCDRPPHRFNKFGWAKNPVRGWHWCDSGELIDMQCMGALQQTLPCEWHSVSSR